MTEWTTKQLGDVLTLQRGFDLAKKRRKPGPFPVVSSAGVTGSHDEFKADPPGVVIGRYGSLGAVHWVTEPYWPLNTALWVKDFKENDPRYLSYLLQTVAVDGSTASAVPGVNRNHLHKLPVRVPGTAVQRRVAAALSAFDELIEINERRIRLLEDLARSLYREWFVHFRFPGHRRTRYVDSELGSIPAGWTASRLGEVADLRYGKALTAKARKPGKVPVVSSAGIIDSHSEALVSGPGIVIGRKGNVGSLWWVAEDFFPIDTTYYVQSKLPLGFLFRAMEDLDFIDSHAAVPGLSRDQASAIPIVVPDRATAASFNESHQKLIDEKLALQALNANAEATRDLLLPRLVTGKLDISDVDLGALTPAEPG